jgi:hypothetical protein
MQQEAAALEQGLAAAAAAAPSDSVDDVMPSTPASPVKEDDVEEEETVADEAEETSKAKDDDISTIASPSDDNTQADEETTSAAMPNMSIPPSVASATGAVADAPTPLKKALAVLAIARAVFLAAAVWALIFVLEAMCAAEARFPKQFARARGTIADVYAKVRGLLGLDQEKSLVECVRSLSPLVAATEAKAASLDESYAGGAVCREVSRAFTDAVREFNKSCPEDARKQLA